VRTVCPLSAATGALPCLPARTSPKVHKDSLALLLVLPWPARAITPWLPQPSDQMAEEAIRAAKRAAREDADKALNDVLEETAGTRYCPSGTKRFWGKLNATHRRRPTPGARSLERADGSVTADPAAIAELFAAHNERVGDPQHFAQGAGFSDTRKRAVERAVRQQLADSHTVPPVPALDAELQRDEVATAVARLHNGKAASPNDDVACELLKKGGDATSRVLHALFSLQWDLEACARTPGVITELHKGGGKPATKTDSYRPIQLLSVIDKCYDRMLNNRLNKHLEEGGLLHEAQNAFRRGRDCLEHVLTLHTVAQRRREQGMDTFLFFNDQEKAYDTAWRLAISSTSFATKGFKAKCCACCLASLPTPPPA
jgi:hypothetical protein